VYDIKKVDDVQPGEAVMTERGRRTVERKERDLFSVTLHYSEDQLHPGVFFLGHELVVVK
jgi:hypothetical protein